MVFQNLKKKFLPRKTGFILELLGEKNGGGYLLLDSKAHFWVIEGILFQKLESKKRFFKNKQGKFLEKFP